MHLALVSLLFAARLMPLAAQSKVWAYFYVHRSQAIGKRAVPAGKLSLIALTDEPLAFDKSRGFRVILANTTRVKGDFEGQDTRLNIVREALDPAGRWRPIEYLAPSFCGNSYHRMFLPPGRYWSFAAPVYRGAFATRMRFVLEQEGLRLVSNEFAGSINLEQFTVIDQNGQPWIQTAISSPTSDSRPVKP